MTARGPSLDGFEARWVRAYPVLGIRTVIEASDPSVAPAVERAFGAWTDLPDGLKSDTSLRFRIHVTEADEGKAGHVPIRYRQPSPLQVRATTPGSVAYADAARGEAWARVSRGLVGDADHFRYGIVEAMVYFMLSHRDRQPFHCAAILRGEIAVLLCGPPGAGKSTLAYAAQRRGLIVMAEDTVWVQQQPRAQIWGLTQVIHLPEDAPRVFPELMGAPTLAANGVRKVAVAVRPASRPATPVARRATVCLLLQGGTAPRLTRMPQGDLAGALAATLQPGFDAFPGTIPAVVEAFAADGGWRLEVGEDPMAAAACLDEVFASL